MMNDLQKLLNEGGTPVTKYSVTVGDSVWTALYSYIDTTYPNIETNVSDYSIKGVYEEDSQKFTILQNNKDGKYYRLNFSLDENNEFSASPDLIEVTDYAANEEPQFSEDSINEFVNEFKKRRTIKSPRTKKSLLKAKATLLLPRRKTMKNLNLIIQKKSLKKKKKTLIKRAKRLNMI